MIKKIRLGDLLLEHQLLSKEQVDSALHTQKSSGMKLGNVLVDMGFIGEEHLLEFLAKQLDIRYVNLTHEQVDLDIAKIIPETVARRYHAIPIEKNCDTFLVAMSDPTDVAAFDEMARRLPGTIDIVIVKDQDLIKVLDEVYRRKEDIETLVGKLEEEIKDINVISKVDHGTEDAPILKLLYSLFEQAVEVSASDIHIEPSGEHIRIRHRVDGALREQLIKGKNILSALILRLKLMAKLNISERRLPQEGRFTLQILDRQIDVRIATMPIEGGEAVTMRLFDQTHLSFSLEAMGMPERILNALRRLLKQSYGMVLVTGPTGSGKSTTLFGALNEINTADKKIITVEDPVEYKFERINQIQVQPKIGLDFSHVLRSALRHDPDVIMVGEIRDEETASIALRAAMTGHLVLTTLHTNNAISSPGRLLEMGVPGFLVACALKLVIAQRLIRCLCEHCQQSYIPNVAENLLLKGMFGTNIQNMHFRMGQGCQHCHYTGYRGRIGVYEVLEVNAPMQQALREDNMQWFVTEARKTPLFRSLTHWALDYACMGITSIQEVFKLHQDIEDE